MCLDIQYMKLVRNWTISFNVCKCDSFYAFYNFARTPTHTGMIASKCAKGTHETYKGLCHQTEDYTKHPHADVYFQLNKSPIVAEWVKNGKEIITNGKMITYKPKL